MGIGTAVPYSPPACLWYGPSWSNVAIGMNATPSATLDVTGTARITSSTAIGMTATPSATVDISATLRLVALTGSGCVSVGALQQLGKGGGVGFSD